MVRKQAPTDLATGQFGLTFWCAASILAFSLLSWLTACSEDDGQGLEPCIPRSTRECPCPPGQTGVQVCLADGNAFSACLCSPAGGDSASGGDFSTGTGGGGGWQQATGGQQPPTGGQSGGASDPPPQNAGAGGSAGQDPPPAGGTGGSADAGPSQPLDGGTSDGSTNPPVTTDSGPSADTGPAVDTGPSNPNDDLDAVRQACVDYINEYRATLNLPPLSRATPEQEACSDQGAQQDGTTGQAHSSAGSCPGLGGQNTCPGYPVGGWTGGNTLEATMKYCLDQMWNEGPPPVSLNECMADYAGCFLVHGHYINMSNDRYSVVSCGFYEVSPGTWWMNQDFGY